MIRRRRWAATWDSCGAWADVDWGEWSKRMPAQYLRVEATIGLVGEMAGWEVTDLTREREIAAGGDDWVG